MSRKFIFLLFLSLMFVSSAGASVDTHWVTQTGDGGSDGTSLLDAFSVAQFNNSANWDTDVDDDDKIGPGDTVYFSGTFTTKVKIPENYGGTAGNYITLDGYEGGTCNPVEDGDNLSSAVLSPCTGASVDCYGLHLEDTRYIIVQDFKIGPAYVGIFSVNDSGRENSNILIRRNMIANTTNYGSQFTWDEADPWGDFLTIGGAPGEGNYYSNTCHTNTNHSLGINYVNDCNISYNKIENDKGNGDYVIYHSHNSISVHTCERVLVEHNYIYGALGQAGIALKEYGGIGGAYCNTVVRYNMIRDNVLHSISGGSLGYGINLASSENRNHEYIYCNMFYNNGLGISIIRDPFHIYMWSNVIIESRGWGGVFGCAAAGDDCKAHDVYFINNTVAESNLSYTNATMTGMYIYTGWDGDAGEESTFLKNNIFFNNRTYAGTDPYQIYMLSAKERYINLEHNLYYMTADTPTLYYSSAENTLATTQGYGWEDDSPAGEIADPDFTDYTNNDYTLGGGHVESAATITGPSIATPFSIANYNGDQIFHSDELSFSIAIDPATTNFFATPLPEVYTKDRGADDWSHGAYGYTGSSGSSGFFMLEKEKTWKTAQIARKKRSFVNTAGGR